MKKLITKTVVYAFALVAVFGMASHAFASGVIDPNPSTFGTGITTVAIAPTTTMGTTKTVNAQPGDVIAVNVYYHNSGNQPINDFTISINPSQTGPTTSATFTGMLSGDGVTSVSDNATVNISSAETLTFIPGSVRWFPNQEGGNTGQTISSADEQALVGGSGFNIGTLTPGWSSQGGIVAQFQVSSSNTCTNCNNGQAPTVSTSNYSGFDPANGDVTLNGYFDSNNSPTSTYFQYQLNGGSWIDTPSISEGIVSGAPFDYSLTNLAPGTYSYEAVATNQYGTNYGSAYTFTIGGGITCPAGYYVSGNTCVQNVQTCPAGYYLSGNTCIQNVQTCPAGYYLSGNTCIQNAPNCPAGYYVSGNTCIQNVQSCPAGYYLSGNTCIQNVQSCPAGYYLSGNTCIQNVQSCPAGYYLSGNSCVQEYQQQSCPAGYYLSGNTCVQNVQTCPAGYSLSGSSCVQNVQTCPAGYYLSGTNCLQQYQQPTNTNTSYVTHYVDVNTGGSGSSFVKLTIDDNRTTDSSGIQIPYDITWENLTSETLNNLSLEVNFPQQVSIVDTTQGSVEPNKTSVIYQIDSLAPHQSGSMTITTQITGNLKDGDPVVAQAIMAFNSPTNQAALNAIAFDTDQYSSAGNVLGASIFGLSFLPNSLIGWLILILILLVIIILAHWYATRNRPTVVVNHLPASGSVPNIPMEPMSQAGAQTNDYVVYRPNPKQ